MVCGRVLRTTRRAADTSPDVLSFGDCQDATWVRTTLGITPGRASTLRARGMARSSFEMRRPVSLPRLTVHGGVTRAGLVVDSDEGAGRRPRDQTCAAIRGSRSPGNS